MNTLASGQVTKLHNPHQREAGARGRKSRPGHRSPSDCWIWAKREFKKKGNRSFTVTSFSSISASWLSIGGISKCPQTVQMMSFFLSGESANERWLNEHAHKNPRSTACRLKQWRASGGGCAWGFWCGGHRCRGNEGNVTTGAGLQQLTSGTPIYRRL